MKKNLKFLVFILSMTSLMSNSYSQADSVTNMKLLKDLTPELSQKLEELKMQLNSGQFNSAQDLTTKMYDIIYSVETKMYPPDENPAPEVDFGKDDESATENENVPAETDGMNMKPKRKSGWKSGMTFHVGFATLLEGSGNPDDKPEINLWRSAMLEYGFNFRKSLNASNTTNLNIGLTYMYLDFDTNDQQLSYDGTKDKVKFVKNEDFKDSDFGAGYINIPITLEFKLTRKINMGIGGFGAIRTNSFSSYELKTSLDEKIDGTVSAKYNMNPFLYGGRLYLGNKTVSVYVNYTANSIFKDQYKLNPISVGLRFGM